MTRYSYDSLTLLCRLIRRDNPNVKQELSAKNIMVLGGPYTNGLGTTGRNTRIRLNGRTGSGIVGKAEFFYDRLNIGSLFNGINVVFAADEKSATVADLLPALNEQYGLGLTNDDITNGATKLGTGYQPTPVTLTIASTSVAFTGALSVIWTREPAGIYPDSGPGSKLLLAGDTTMGYFGVVTQAEFAKNVDLYEAMKGRFDDTTVFSTDTNLVWYKFYLDNEVVFFPSLNLASGVTYVGLDAAGAAKGNAEYPFVVKSATGQSFFQALLPKFSETDPVALGRYPDGYPARLFNKLHTGEYGTGEWDNLTINSNQFLYQTRRLIGSPPYPVYVGTINLSTLDSIGESAKTNWRPMLKLIDGKLVLVPVQNVIGEVYGRIIPPALSIDARTDPKIPIRVKNIRGTFYRVVPTVVISQIASKPVRAVSNLRAGTPLKSFSFTITPIIRAKTDLSKADGELAGF